MPPYNGVEDFLQGSRTMSEFVWPTDDRPKILHNEYDGNQDLPVIDLSPLPSDNPEVRSKIAEQIVHAGGKWGFFQVINHNLSPELLANVINQTNKLFDLPTEEKQRCTTATQGYGARVLIARGRQWREVYHIDRNSAQDYSTHRENSKLAFGEGPDHKEFSASIDEFQVQAEKLAVEVLKLCAEGLGLQQSCFLQFLKDGHLPVYPLRLNHYPPCPEPCQTLGQGPHKDANLLTVLLQDEVGGLQVQPDDGSWVTVRPRHGALVINIGGLFQAWSNGRLKSVDHRVVVNATQPRTSIGAFFQLVDPEKDGDVVVYPPPELVDAQHPRLYLSFTVAEYWAHFLSTPRGGAYKQIDGFLLPQA